MSTKKLHPDGYFFQRVKDLLDSGEIDRAGLCEKLYISEGYISMILNGVKKKPSERLTRLLDAAFPLEKTSPRPAVDTELQTIINRWDELPESIKRRMMRALYSDTDAEDPSLSKTQPPPTCVNGD